MVLGSEGPASSMGCFKKEERLHWLDKEMILSRSARPDARKNAHQSDILQQLRLQPGKTRKSTQDRPSSTPATQHCRKNRASGTAAGDLRRLVGSSERFLRPVWPSGAPGIAQNGPASFARCGAAWFEYRAGLDPTRRWRRPPWWRSRPRRRRWRDRSARRRGSPSSRPWTGSPRRPPSRRPQGR